METKRAILFRIRKTEPFGKLSTSSYIKQLKVRHPVMRYYKFTAPLCTYRDQILFSLTSVVDRPCHKLMEYMMLSHFTVYIYVCMNVFGDLI